MLDTVSLSFSKNNDGVLTIDEFIKIGQIEDDLDLTGAIAAFKAIDINDDGELSKEEFMTFMSK